jgi:hypothetical protein
VERQRNPRSKAPIIFEPAAAGDRVGGQKKSI